MARTASLQSTRITNFFKGLGWVRAQDSEVFMTNQIPSIDIDTMIYIYQKNVVHLFLKGSMYLVNIYIYTFNFYNLCIDK